MSDAHRHGERTTRGAEVIAADEDDDGAKTVDAGGSGSGRGTVPNRAATTAPPASAPSGLDAVIAFRPTPPPLDADFCNYVANRLRAGLLSDEAAVAALRARKADVTAADVLRLLGKGSHED